MVSIGTLSAAVAMLYVGAFLVLSMILARRTGRPVWLFGADRRQALPALLFRLAFAGAVLWPLAVTLLGDRLPEGPGAGLLESRVIGLIGLVLTVAGAALAIAAQHHMGESWRIGAVEGQLGSIVDGGPFAFSRNPVFVGQALLFVGLFLARPGIVQGALTAMLIAAIALQVRIEERVLAASLGEPYRAYSARVGRWLGRRTASAGAGR